MRRDAFILHKFQLLIKYTYKCMNEKRILKPTSTCVNEWQCIVKLGIFLLLHLSKHLYLFNYRMIGNWSNTEMSYVTINGTEYVKHHYGIVDYLRAITIMFLPPIICIRKVFMADWFLFSFSYFFCAKNVQLEFIIKTWYWKSEKCQKCNTCLGYFLENVYLYIQYITSYN